jgi:hypothetical protein
LSSRAAKRRKRRATEPRAIVRKWVDQLSGSFCAPKRPRQAGWTLGLPETPDSAALCANVGRFKRSGRDGAGAWEGSARRRR